MNRWFSFFEIPAKEFQRAVKFYQQVMEVELASCDFGEEKMAFFPKDEAGIYGAVIESPDFQPSGSGVLITLDTGDDLTGHLERIETGGGTVLRPKTRIGGDGLGYFALFRDTEGNRLGLHSRG